MAKKKKNPAGAAAPEETAPEAAAAVTETPEETAENAAEPEGAQQESPAGAEAGAGETEKKDGFSVMVRGITKQEFLEANRSLARTPFLYMLLVILGCILVVILTGSVSNPWSLLWFLTPIPILLIFREYGYRSSFKKGPFKDLALDYDFNPDGWTVSMEGASGGVAWADTKKIVRTANDLLLYVRVYTANGKRKTNSSNVIPLRCIEEQQIAQLRSWFSESKARVKAKQAEMKKK